MTAILIAGVIAVVVIAVLLALPAVYPPDIGFDFPDDD